MAVEPTPGHSGLQGSGGGVAGGYCALVCVPCAAQSTVHRQLPMAVREFALRAPGPAAWLRGQSEVWGSGRPWARVPLRCRCILPSPRARYLLRAWWVAMRATEYIVAMVEGQAGSAPIWGSPNALWLPSTAQCSVPLCSPAGVAEFGRGRAATRVHRQVRGARRAAFEELLSAGRHTVCLRKDIAHAARD